MTIRPWLAHLVAAFSGLLLCAFEARSQDAFWREAGHSSADRRDAPGESGSLRPARLYALNPGAMRSHLARAPRESQTHPAASQLVISLPRPDGTLARFRFVESSVMAPGLATRYPQIKTYVGQGIDEPGATARFDLTPAGFHAQVLSPAGAVYIEPGRGTNAGLHVCYHKRDARAGGRGFECLVSEQSPAISALAAQAPQAAAGGAIRTFRLACAATAEYTACHGGTVPAGLAAIVTAINRVNGIYETELGIRLQLVEHNDRLVYTNASTDPYSNADAWALVGQNQSNLDQVIGPANYDVGHVFNTAGGGLAVVGSVCVNGLKAQGQSGISAPVNDAFYVDYVAHELGHQFGANHCFNGSGGICGANRYAASACEPGSGSTIMGYAGICSSDNLQSHSDPYFHSRSLEEILNFTTTGTGSGCAVASASGNTAPSVTTGANVAIPRSTPFSLAATGSDPDGDVLTYCWEQRDLGSTRSLGTADNGTGPLFRSYAPVTDPGRTFPRLEDILGGVSSASEQLPTLPRVMLFRVTARDNHPGGGAIATADRQVTVASNAGPFVVTSPVAGVTWSNVQTVAWSVAGTFDAPVNAKAVNIFLSTNGGLSFPVLLASNVPNTGSFAVTLPSISCAQCRIRVAAAGNIFFNINNGNFTIKPVYWPPNVALDSITITAETGSPVNGLIDPGETVLVQIALKNTGDLATSNLVATLVASNGVVAPSGPQNYGILPGHGVAVSRPFVFTAAGTCGNSVTAILQLNDGGKSLPSILIHFTLGSVTIATQSFNAPRSISILDAQPASPYPSAIWLAGFQGVVAHATVTLRGFSHAWPEDVGMLLVGPDGRKALIMANAGASYAVADATLTLDDGAAEPLPRESAIVSGSYQPAAYDGGAETFALPAPAPPYGSALSVFNGANPNGLWSLYVQDDYSGDAGSIALGWTLTLTTSNSVCCSNSVASGNLGVSAAFAPAVARAAELVACTVLVTNPGLKTVEDVVVAGVVPDGLNYVSASASQGTCAYAGGILTASLGVIPKGAAASISLLFSAPAAGGFTNTFIVTSAASDPATFTNNISASVIILPVGTRLPPTAPAFKSIVVSSNGVTLRWSTVNSQTYRLQYTDNVGGTNWLDLAPDVTATASEASATDPAPPATNRWYRVWALP